MGRTHRQNRTAHLPARSWIHFFDRLHLLRLVRGNIVPPCPGDLVHRRIRHIGTARIGHTQARECVVRPQETRARNAPDNARRPLRLAFAGHIHAHRRNHVGMGTRFRRDRLRRPAVHDHVHPRQKQAERYRRTARWLRRDRTQRSGEDPPPRRPAISLH